MKYSKALVSTAPRIGHIIWKKNKLEIPVIENSLSSDRPMDTMSKTIVDI